MVLALPNASRTGLAWMTWSSRLPLDCEGVEGVEGGGREGGREGKERGGRVRREEG